MNRSIAVAKLRRGQGGSYLLEALIAILIFAFGVLGLIGLLGNSIRVSNDARYRSEAANLANAMVADMWTTTAAKVEEEYGSSGTKLAEWKDKAGALLPDADAKVELSDGLSAQSRSATVTISWKLPGESAEHQHMMTAQIGRN